MGPQAAAALGIVIGIAIGITLAGLCKSGKISSLQNELGAKKDAWCAGCTLNRRLQSKMDLLSDREAYIRSLEERIDRQQRSISQLGANLHKKTLRTA
jgi:hypothetical protein